MLEQKCIGESRK